MNNLQDTGDALCFKEIFTDNQVFGIVLSILLVICVVFFIRLALYWYQRKFWFPMQERSTYCTFAYLIASSSNLLIQPLTLIAYNISNSSYTMEGTVEKMIKFLYIFTRFSLTTIYIAKVSRLVYAFNVKEINKYYYFFKSEAYVLSAAISTSTIVSLVLILTESQNIILVIETAYSHDVQNFWIPLQCIEAIVYSTLIVAMQNVAPYYQIRQEIIATFLSNTFLSIVYYSLYPSKNQYSYCHPVTDYRTYVIFAVFELRNIINIFFCVYIPLRRASIKPIPLPNERELLNTVDGNYSMQQFYVILTYYHKEVEEPFLNYLIYFDKQIQLQTSEGITFQHRLDCLQQKYHLIKHIRSFSLLYQCYIEISLALEEGGDQKKMSQVVQKYIDQNITESADIAVQTLSFENNETNNNQQHLFSPSCYSSNVITVNAGDQSAHAVNQKLFLSKTSCWNKIFGCCSKKNDNSHLKQLFVLQQNTYLKIVKSFYDHTIDNDRNERRVMVNQLESQRNALQDVQNEIFQYIHILWKDFYYRTKSFSYLREEFMRYGSTRNHLLKFNLSNQIYKISEDSQPSKRNSIDE